MKAADLRKSILQAAVQGKLAPQDKNDEPASELLKRIQAEKAALIKEGKLKKEKPLPPIAEDEIPYDLPAGWAWCRLTDITRYNKGAIRRGPFGSSIRKDMFVPKDTNTYKVYEQGNAIRKSIDYGTYYLSEQDYNKLSSFAVSPRDIIISCAGTLGETYQLPDNAPKGVINQALLKLQMNDSIMDANFFMLVFKATTQYQISLSSMGSAMKNMLSIDWLKTKVLFPLPPINEQNRIVAKADELMALCDELEAAEKELDALENRFAENLPKSILQAAVQGKLAPQDKNDEPASELLKRIQAEKAALIKEGKLKKQKPLPPIAENEIPYDLPNGWIWCRLGELIVQAPNDNIHSTKKPNTMIHYVDIDAIDNIHHRIFHDKYLPVNQLSSRARRVLSKGYVLYSLVRPYLNNIAIVEDEKENYIGSTGFTVFKPLQASVFYFKYLLLSPFITQYYTPMISGFNSPSISQTDFINTPFPLPPLAEQQRIAAKMDELISLCKELKCADSRPIHRSNAVPCKG